MGGETCVGCLLKLSCMEATEMAGLFDSIKGLKSPSDDSLTSLILLGFLLTLYPTWLLGKLVSASLRGVCMGLNMEVSTHAKHGVNHV